MPVEYPTACSPQAWAAGAPLLFITTMLGMRPEGEQLKVDAHLPAPIGVLHLDGVRGRWGDEPPRALPSGRRGSWRRS